MLDDPSIKAVVASRGGYGTVRILDRLDFKGFINDFYSELYIGMFFFSM